MKVREIDKKFDAGEDISAYFDTAKALRPAQELKRVNIDFPV